MPETDAIDGIIDQWARERPDLDARGFAIVGRLLVLAKHLERRMERAFAPLDLKPWAFDVLATLRRQGAPYRLTPGEISRAVMLTTGAMTNRLDRLEAAGLIRREPDPADRRGVRVVLTKSGVALADQAIAVRFAVANTFCEALSARDKAALEPLLRCLLQAADDEPTT